MSQIVYSQRRDIFFTEKAGTTVVKAVFAAFRTLDHVMLLQVVKASYPRDFVGTVETLIGPF